VLRVFSHTNQKEEIYIQRSDPPVIKQHTIVEVLYFHDV